MPQFLIERTVPGANLLSQAELQTIAQRSMCAMEQMNSDYRWLRSYIVGNKFFCVHEARDAEAVREHARRGGFPITNLSRIDGTFGPASAKSPESAAVSG
jgi:hypothetical protein